MEGQGISELQAVAPKRYKVEPMTAKPRLPIVYDVVMKDDLPRETLTKWNNDVQTDRFDGCEIAI
jgi:hypothetical protein